MQQSVLFYICREGKIKCLSLLLDAGCQLDDQDQNGQTPLFFAARENRKELVLEMIRRGCNCYHVDTVLNQTALYYASREGNIEMCKILVENGCKVSHVDVQKKNALFYAKKFKQQQVMEYLNSCLNKEKDEQKQTEDSQPVRSDSKPSFNNKRPRETKEVQAKLPFSLVYTDERDNQSELTQEKFEEFKSSYPDIAKLILSPETEIDDDLANKVLN